MTSELQKTQLRFEVPSSGALISTPENASDFVFQLLAERKLWKNRNKRVRNGIAIDLELGRICLIDTYNWQLRGDLELENLKIRRDKSAAIIFAGKVDSQKAQEIIYFLDQVHDFLIHSSPVFVLEEGIGLDDGQVERRRSILMKNSYAEANVLKKPLGGFLLWEGRMEKKRPKGKTHDLLNETSKNRDWLLRELYKQIAEHKRLGYSLVGEIEEQPIYKELRSTKMIPWTISSLKNGFGLKIKKDKCGVCAWEIDTKGVELKIDHCGDCETESPKKRMKMLTAAENLKYDLVNVQVLGEPFCADCGSHRELIYKFKKTKGQFVTLEETIYCPEPSCGWKSVKQISVPKAQVVGMS